MKELLRNKRMLFSALWLVFTITFGGWWLFLGLKQARMVADLKKSIGGKVAEESFGELERFDRMMKWEGASFLVLLAIGGGTLLYLSYKDDQNTRLMNDFFSTVTHEMKTPLASLRLQVESLTEDLEAKKYQKVLRRLSHDLLRIESQMEKALYLANMARSKIVYLEKTALDDVLAVLEMDWPIIQYSKSGIYLKADRRGLESILRNLVENSANHGKADEVVVRVEAGDGLVTIVVQDNGCGFSGELKNLGKPFVRHSSSSGTGLGIYLVSNLLQRMDGKMELRPGSEGFGVAITLPEWSEA